MNVSDILTGRSWKPVDSAAVVDGVPVDPVNPPESGIEHCDRDIRELAQWWERPYVVTRSPDMFDVRCLDGGSGGRTTWIGSAATLEEAVDIAKAYTSPGYSSPFGPSF